MKSLIVFIVAFVSFNLSGQPQNGSCDCGEVAVGETVKYKIKYGWFKIGEAEISTDPDLHYFDNEPHYFVRFKMKTQGLLSLFADLNLDFDSYVNANTLKPYKSRRYIKDGKDEDLYADHFIYSDSIYVQTLKNENKPKSNAFEDSSAPFVDALSTYLFVRTRNLDMRSMESMKLYYSDKLYDMELHPNGGLRKRNQKHLKSYQIKLPSIDAFPEGKESYAMFSGKTNVLEEVKLATSDGNIYLIRDN